MSLEQLAKLRGFILLLLCRSKQSRRFVTFVQPTQYNKLLSAIFFNAIKQWIIKSGLEFVLLLHFCLLCS